MRSARERSSVACPLASFSLPPAHIHNLHVLVALQRPMQWEAYKLPVTFSVHPADVCLAEFTSPPRALYLCTTAESNAQSPGHVNACTVPESRPDRAYMRCTVQRLCLPGMQPSASSTATGTGHDPLMCNTEENCVRVRTAAAAHLARPALCAAARRSGQAVVAARPAERQLAPARMT